LNDLLEPAFWGRNRAIVLHRRLFEPHFISRLRFAADRIASRRGRERHKRPCKYFPAAGSPSRWIAKMHILLVDDDPGIRNVYQLSFELEGHSSAAASGAREALALLEQQPFDVVLLDIDMPGMSGWDLLKEMRAVPSTARTPTVIMSAFARYYCEERARGLSVSAMLTKPVAPQSVLETLLRAAETNPTFGAARGTPARGTN
jgi:CheY-like chemotaxis protein